MVRNPAPALLLPQTDLLRVDWNPGSAAKAAPPADLLGSLLPGPRSSRVTMCCSILVMFPAGPPAAPATCASSNTRAAAVTSLSPILVSFVVYARFIICSSWTKRLITSGDKASIQVNVGDVDAATGKYTGTFKTFAL